MKFEEFRTIIGIICVFAWAMFFMILLLCSYYFPYGIGLGIGIESPDIDAAKRSLSVMGYCGWCMLCGVAMFVFILITELFAGDTP